MKFTETQLHWLRWLDQVGGRAIPWGVRIKAAGRDEETGMGAAISFVNLVAKGAVTGGGGYLEITDYGRRLLKP